MAKKATTLGPHSPAERLMKVDGRTRLGKLMSSIRADLVEHLGGSPSVPEQLIIGLVVVKAAKLVLGQEAALTDATDAHHWLAWSSSLRRDLEALGLKADVVKPKALNTYIKETDNEAD